MLDSTSKVIASALDLRKIICLIFVPRWERSCMGTSLSIRTHFSLLANIITWTHSHFIVRTAKEKTWGGKFCWYGCDRNVPLNVTNVQVGEGEGYVLFEYHRWGVAQKGVRRLRACSHHTGQTRPRLNIIHYESASSFYSINVVTITRNLNRDIEEWAIPERIARLEGIYQQEQVGWSISVRRSLCQEQSRSVWSCCVFSIATMEIVMGFILLKMAVQNIDKSKTSTWHQQYKQHVCRSCYQIFSSGSCTRTRMTTKNMFRVGTRNAMYGTDIESTLPRWTNCSEGYATVSLTYEILLLSWSTNRVSGRCPPMDYGDNSNGLLCYAR